MNALDFPISSLDENEQVRMAMLQQQPEAMPGEALSAEDLKKNKLYFEAQPANSDTCGMNALNNLCQRPQFKLADLQQAEAKHAQMHKGGHFMHSQPQNLPTGFFDIEALKIAAQKSGLEIVDVEPVMDYSKSPCRAFSDAAASSDDSSWFLGFLVYDRRPGFFMHYYALRRDERFAGIWLRLDSLLAQSGEESKNRRLTMDNLWATYQANAHFFGAWVLRWYPVVYCKGAADEVVKRLKRTSDCTLSEERALKALKQCGWVVCKTVRYLLEDVPRATVRELLVSFARPSEAEMRSALEAAEWDVAAAQPAIDKVLRERIALAQDVEPGGIVLTALSLCDWEPKQAATVLSLQLHCKSLKLDMTLSERGHPGYEPSKQLALLHEALQLAGADVDHAEALLRLLPSVGTMSQTKRLLEQAKWSGVAAQKILEVQKRIPRVSNTVALEVLKRNDEDPHAACEMLAEYQKGVQRLVLENAFTDLAKGDEMLIAEAALDLSDWDPAVAFVSAKNLLVAVEQTRRIVQSQGQAQSFAVDTVLAALTAGEQKPEAAACLLLGLPLPDSERRPAGPAKGYPPEARTGNPVPQRPALQESRGQTNQEEEEYCCVM